MGAPTREKSIKGKKKNRTGTVAQKVGEKSGRGKNRTRWGGVGVRGGGKRKNVDIGKNGKGKVVNRTNVTNKQKGKRKSSGDDSNRIC